MRHIDYIIIHCADTYSSMDIGVNEIDEWHKAKGWKGVGYHYVIRRNGVVETGRDESEIGAHVTGFNSHSIGICWVGGKGSNNQPEDNRTEQQRMTLRSLVLGLHTKYPDAQIKGHSDFTDKKACPCFNVESEFGWLNNSQDERETEKSMEVVEREKNQHRDGDNNNSARRESFRPKPIGSRTDRIHTNGRVIDRGIWTGSQRGENELSTEFYEDKIEKSIRSQIKWKWGFSISIQKIINFFKQLKRR